MKPTVTGIGVVYTGQFLFPSSSAFPATKDDIPALGEILQSGRHESLTEEKHQRLGHLVAFCTDLIGFSTVSSGKVIHWRRKALSKVFQST